MNSPAEVVEITDRAKAISALANELDDLFRQEREMTDRYNRKLSALATKKRAVEGAILQLGGRQ